MLLSDPKTKESRMSVATVPRIVSGQSDVQGELQAELRHIRDLVLVRNMLRERGATSTELREYDAGSTR
jgi:hypothetical protein